MEKKGIIEKTFQFSGRRDIPVLLFNLRPGT
jgi:hypothetical protein